MYIVKYLHKNVSHHSKERHMVSQLAHFFYSASILSKSRTLKKDWATMVEVGQLLKADISKFNQFLKANLQRQPDLLGGVEQKVFFRRLNESQDSDAVLDQVLVEKLSVPRVHPEVRVEVLEDNDAVLAHALRDFDEVGQVLADNAQLEKENQENVLLASKFIEDYQVNV